MKRLFVLRHAKSSWDHPGLPDFKRPLNGRGEKAAPLIGESMLQKGYEPQTILSSPAERARSTAKLVKENASISAEIIFDERIYGASSNSLLHIISEIDEDPDSAMIVGHNPGFEDLVQVICGKYERMPTAALAVIDLEIDEWSEIESGCGELVEVLRPKDLGNF